MKISELINDNIDNTKYGALSIKLKWFLKRCVLCSECEIKENGEPSYESAEEKLYEFLKNNNYITEENEKLSYSDKLEKIYAEEEFEKNLYKFLESQEDNEEKINNSWKEHAELFIKILVQYREIGSIDKNISDKLMEYAKRINNDPLRYVYEIIQNADDCDYDEQIKQRQVTINIFNDRIEVTYPEKGMSCQDIIALTTIGQSNKLKKKKKRIIGEKGRGFKTIFSVCDYAEIYSGPFHFKLNEKNFTPEWINSDDEQITEGTKLILHFRCSSGAADGITMESGSRLFGAIKERYGFDNMNKSNILKYCPVIFTNKINELKIRYENSVLSAKREFIPDVINADSGFVSGQMQINCSNSDENKECELKCFRFEKNVQFTYNEYISRYKEIFTDEEDYRRNLKAAEYPVILIAPDPDDEDDENIRKWHGNLFSYLPTSTEITAPVSIQIPYELNENRSCMFMKELKGEIHDQEDYAENGLTTKWNQRLFDEVFTDKDNNISLIRYAYEEMNKKLKGNVSIYDYFPDYNINNYCFFASTEKTDSNIHIINDFCGKGDKNKIFITYKNLKVLKKINSSLDDEYCSFNDNPVVFDEFVSTILKEQSDISWIDNMTVNSVSIIEMTDIEEKYKNLKVLGIKKAEIKNQTEFADKLLEISYDCVINELASISHSSYLPEKGQRKALKAIKINTERKSPEDFELWIPLEKADAGFNKYQYLNFFNDKEIESIYDNNDFPNKSKENSWSSVWEKIYQYGGHGSVNCSFGLYKELINHFGTEDDWFDYSRKCIEGKTEISSDNIKTIWNLNYKKYREEIEDDEKDDEKEKCEILGVISFNLSNCKDNYDLIPVKEWTKNLCIEINKTDFDKIYNLCTDGENCISEFSAQLDILNQVNKKINEIYIYPGLPVNFVRFSGKLILRSREDFENEKEKIINSVVSNLSLVKKYDAVKEELFKNHKPVTEYNQETLKNISDICALSAKFNLNKRSYNGEDNNVWHELLQNANDHILKDSDRKMSIKLDDLHLILKYPDSGFSPADFMAICTEGNSANNNSDENREGKKGTGFKSVYNYFDKVIIQSGPVKCILEDICKKIEISDDEISVSGTDGEQRVEHYPIPEFSELENSEKTTEIIFHLRKDRKLSEIQKLIFGSENNNISDALNDFKNKKDYLFLDNIKTINISFKDVSEEFDREEHINSSYVIKTFDIDREKIDTEASPYWKERKKKISHDKAEKILEQKRKVTFLFPKPKDDDLFEGSMSNDAKVYCTLPVEGINESLPFYVNLPLLELENDRRSLSHNNEEWNKNIIIQGLFYGYQSVINEISKQGDSAEDINLENLYNYFPFDYIQKGKTIISGLLWHNEDSAEDYDLYKVKFLRSVTSCSCEDSKISTEDVTAAAIDDLVKSDKDVQADNKTVFIPCNTYSWLHGNKERTEFKIDYDYTDNEGHYSKSEKAVPFIFYSNGKEEDIKKKIDENSLNLYSHSYKKIPDNVGIVLLNILNHLMYYTVELKNKKIYVEWLKKLKNDKYFSFKYKLKFIYSAFFRTDGVNLNDKFQCINNHDLKNEPDEYEGYKSLTSCFTKLKETLDNNPDINAFKLCFINLTESPYFTYKYDYDYYYDYDDDKCKFKESKSLREDHDNLLPDKAPEIWKDKEFLCSCTDEVFNYCNSVSDDKKETIKKHIKNWISRGDILYARSNKGTIIPLSDEIYYSDKEISGDSFVQTGKDFLKNLIDAIKDKDNNFFKINENNYEIINQITEYYPLNDWLESANAFISMNDVCDTLKQRLFEKMLKQGSEIEWMDDYRTLIRHVSANKINAVFRFNKDQIEKLPKNMIDLFEDKVSDSLKNNTSENEKQSLRDIVKEKIYLLECEKGSKSVYCKGKVEDNDVYVIFSKRSFGKLLREKFECQEYSEVKSCEEMKCNPVDGLRDSCKAVKSDEFTEKINLKVKDLCDKWNSRRSDHSSESEIRQKLIGRFDVRNKKWFKAAGYGKEKECPVCKSFLIAEQSVLRVKSIVYTDENQNDYYLPMLMCKNCTEAIDYSDKVLLHIPDGEIDTSDNSFQEFEIEYILNGRESKKIKCSISFLNRSLWKYIIENNQ